MRTLQEIQDSLQEKLNHNKSKIQEFNDKITEAEQLKMKADEDLLASEQEVNAEKYNEAKNAIWTAEHAKELYLKKIEGLQNDKLVTAAEYKQLLSEIKNIADKEHEEQLNEVIPFIVEIKRIAEESEKNNLLANSLIKSLQREVYREPQGKILLENGMTTWSSDKDYKNHNTVYNFYKNSIEGTEISKRAGEDKEQTYKYWGQ